MVPRWVGCCVITTNWPANQLVWTVPRWTGLGERLVLCSRQTGTRLAWNTSLLILHYLTQLGPVEQGPLTCTTLTGGLPAWTLKAGRPGLDSQGRVLRLGLHWIKKYNSGSRFTNEFPISLNYDYIHMLFYRNNLSFIFSFTSNGKFISFIFCFH